MVLIRFVVLNAMKHNALAYQVTQGILFVNVQKSTSSVKLIVIVVKVTFAHISSAKISMNVFKKRFHVVLVLVVKIFLAGTSAHVQHHLLAMLTIPKAVSFQLANALMVNALNLKMIHAKMLIVVLTLFVESRVIDHPVLVRPALKAIPINFAIRYTFAQSTMTAPAI